MRLGVIKQSFFGFSGQHGLRVTRANCVVYKWVPAKMLGVTLRWTSIPSRGGVETPLVASCYKKPEISAGLMGLLARNRHFRTFAPPSLLLVLSPRFTDIFTLFFCHFFFYQLKQFPPESSATQLVQVLKDTDPDDTFSSVPYEKGSCFLYYLEQILGGPGYQLLYSSSKWVINGDQVVGNRNT